MPVREQEIRERLAAAAADVSAPAFALDSVVRRTRVCRARRSGGAVLSVAGVLLAAVVSLSSLGAGHPSVGSAHPPAAPWLPIRVSMLGQSKLITRLTRPGAGPIFLVPAGQRVTMTAQVTVPRGVRVRELWLGLTPRAVESGGPAGPTGWAPVLLRTHRLLTPGQWSFRLHWDVPASVRPGRTSYLIAYWVVGNAAPEPIIARLVIRRG